MSCVWLPTRNSPVCRLRPPYSQLGRPLRSARRQQDLAAALPTAKVVHLLQRGDINKPQQEVPPGALSASSMHHRDSLRVSQKESLRRAALADWIAHRDNVLTWRSAVNRVWHYHFGRGICDTPSDFGRMGGVPSHPELIDWLAVWFRDEAGGSLKKLHRLIVTSRTYRQSAESRPEAVQSTPATACCGGRIACDSTRILS